MMPLAEYERPFYEILIDAITNGEAPFDWVTAVFASSGIGTTGFGFFLILTISVGLKNWSESFTIPMVWLVLMTSALVAMVPAPVADRLFGLIVAGIAFALIGILYYARR